MWTGYTPVVRRTSSSTSPTADPIGSPTSTYPPELYNTNPRTPPPHHQQRQQRRKSLSRVEEGVMEDDHHESTAELIARDYARGGTTIDVDSGSDGEGNSFKTNTITPRRMNDSVVDDDKIEEGDFIPPPSVHDEYLSAYIQPLQHPVTSIPKDGGVGGRPNALRSTSTPANGLVTSPLTLGSKASIGPLRGLGLGQPHEAAIKEDGKPIFEIFNAELREGSEGMAKALKGHLEDVLRVQEEIGRMHLALEGLGDGRRPSGSGLEGNKRESGSAGSPKSPKKENGKDVGQEDVLEKREKGVNELMERLSTLSNNLRTYHRLGTPSLSFSHSHADGGLLSPISPTSPGDPPPMNRQHSANPGFITTSPENMTISPSPPKADQARFLPLRNSVAVHKGVDDLRKQEGYPSRRSTLGKGRVNEESGSGQRDQDQRQASTNSDLPPLRLSVDDYNYHQGLSPDGTKKKSTGSPSPSFWDLEGQKRGTGSSDSWMEHDLAPHEMPDSGSGNGERRSGSGSVSARNTRFVQGRKHVDSPMEMIDRSRPW